MARPIKRYRRRPHRPPGSRRGTALQRHPAKGRAGGGGRTGSHARGMLSPPRKNEQPGSMCVACSGLLRPARGLRAHGSRFRQGSRAGARATPNTVLGSMARGCQGGRAGRGDAQLKSARWVHTQQGASRWSLCAVGRGESRGGGWPRIPAGMERGGGGGWHRGQGLTRGFDRVQQCSDNMGARRASFAIVGPTVQEWLCRGAGEACSW